MKSKWMMLCPLVVSLSACGNTTTPANSEVQPGVDPNPIVVENPKTPTTEGETPSPQKTIALVYEGPGSCEEDCSKASADSALLAGYTPRIVGPTTLKSTSTPEQIAALFKDVAIWIQPGGYARQAYNAMTPTLRKALKDFIAQGGGYVGFCAGAFITTKYIGSTGSYGLGIFPGSTAPLGTGSTRETVFWSGKKRTIYFEGGPYMYNVPSSVEVTAYYDDKKTIASARTTYGKGRVYITGPHPEAPAWWNHSTDPDGSDRDLAVEMIKWAAAQ